MIQANELRIGNWVINIHNEYQQVFKISDYAMNVHKKCTEVVNAKPIPITPERLEKCGFEIDELRCWGKINLPNSPTVLLINCSNGIGRGTVWLRNQIGSINITSMYHMHILQNLYFSLTGEELTFKP